MLGTAGDSRKQSRFPVRVGLTLVELLVAITLAASLMVAITSLLKSLRRPLLYAERSAAPLWPERLASMLRQDLLAASGVHRQGDTVWITGNLSSSLFPDGGTSLVGYGCYPVTSSRWALVRIESEGFELVALGPRRLVIERIDDLGIPQPLPPAAGPIPNRLRMWIYGRDPRAPEVIRDIALW